VGEAGLAGEGKQQLLATPASFAPIVSRRLVRLAKKADQGDIGVGARVGVEVESGPLPIPW